MLHDGRIACIRCKEADSIVSPIIVQPLSINDTGIFHLVKFKNWHKLNRVDSKILQIWNLLPQSFKRTRCFHFRRCILGKASYMHLIDHKIFKWNIQIFCFLPVKVILYNSGMVNKICTAFRPLSPFSLSGNCSRIWIQ